MVDPEQEVFRSLRAMCRSAKQQLAEAQASGDPERIASWQAIVEQCEQVIIQAGGRLEA